jgi:gliding motility-associated-like protein
VQGVPYIWTGGTLTVPDTAISITVDPNPSTPQGYTYTIGLGSGCPATASITLTAYVVSATQGTLTQPSCGQNNGSINYSISASHSFQTVLLKNGVVVEQGSQTQFSNLGPGTYIFVIHDIPSGCTDTLPAIVLTDPSTIPVFDSVVVTAEKCFGDKDGAVHIGVGNCGGGCTFTWSPNTSDQSDSAVALAAGTYTFSVTLGGCASIDTVITVPGPTAALSDVISAHPDHCLSGIGSAFDSVSGGTPPFTYVWSMGNALGDSVTGLAGDSIVKVTVTDSHGCSISDSAYISSTPRPKAVISSPSDTICQTENTGILTVSPVPADSPYTYLWSNGSTTTVAAGLTPGVYSVSVYDAGRLCDTVVYGTVYGYNPTLSASVVPGVSVPAGQQVEISLLTNVPVTDVVWSPYDSLQGSRGNTTVGFTAEQNEQITVVLTYGQACQLFDTINIYILSDTGSKFVIPNTFTPNHDGINDYFYLTTYPPLSSFHIWIFDRWGSKVYEATDADFQWDGSDSYGNNGTFNSGVFAYVIEYQALNSGDKKVIGGNISLIR